MIEYDTLTYTKIEVVNDLLASFEEEGYTYLHCTYQTSARYSSGWWVNMNLESYLVNGEEQLKMIEAINIPISPQKHFFKKFGDILQFTLIFPAIPKNWQTFNFIERTASKLSFRELTDSQNGSILFNLEESKGLYINNITRNSTGVYKVIIQ